jgi:hypothetical protein
MLYFLALKIYIIVQYDFKKHKIKKSYLWKNIEIKIIRDII